MEDITKEDWKEMVANDNKAVIIDVRAPHEWREGVIGDDPLLLNIQDPNSFMDGIEALDPDKNYYVYCRSGVRSVRACQIMESIGINNTYNLLGGILEFNE
jgi:rhodanese-related sulfurtransferase